MKQKKTYRYILTHFKPLTVAFLVIFGLFNVPNLIAQEVEPQKATIETYTQDELLEMPLEDLMALVKKFKLSSLEELYARVLNPEIETASKFSEKYFNAPLSTSVVTSEEIMASGALNIPEALRLVPGLIVRQKTNGNYDVHIRGNDNIPSGQTSFYSENSLTLVMIDYRPVYNHFQGGTFWESLPINLENIDRIEIIYGPSSALYGPNAVSGVIHIFTKKQTKEGLQSHVQLQYGTNSSQDAQANIAYKKDQFTVRITANYQKLNRFSDEYYLFDNYLDTIKKGRYIPSDSLSYFIQDAQDKFPTPSLASNKMASNLYLNYEDDDGGIFFSTGIQQSDIQSVFLDTREFALTGRRNQSMYSNLRYLYKGLTFNASYNTGVQNLALGYPSYEFRFGNFQTNIDYLFRWKGLKILPGFNYQDVFYDDQKYLEKDEIGIFNGKQKLSNTAISLRLDYSLFQKWRLTGAIRWEWFSLPNKKYLSYQLTSSYKIDNKSNLRFVYSKANRGPFMWDHHVNFTKESQFDDINLIFNYNKNPELKLLEMHMLELGFRSKLLKNISTDFNFFYNKTKNYNLPEVNISQTNPNNYHIDVQQENLPLISEQMGISIALEAIISRSLQVKMFGTLQQTTLDKLDSYYLIDDHTAIVVEDDSKIHKSTPKFTGGINLNYIFKKKLMANADLYYLSQQEFYTYDGYKEINAKAILNMKISYMFWRKYQLFISGRNILNNTDYEFIFSDKVGSEFLLGLSFNFN